MKSLNTEMSTDEEVSAYAEANNVDIVTAILETNPEVFVYEEAPEAAIDLTPEKEEVIEEVVAKEEPEVFDYDEAPELRQTKIPFLQPDFPWLTLSQLKRLPKAELIELCEKYEKETDGTKADLVKRLID